MEMNKNNPSADPSLHFISYKEDPNVLKINKPPNNLLHLL